MSEDEIIRSALERGWVTPQLVEEARRLEADLRAQGRSPGLLAVLAQAMAPEHVDALRREHAAETARLSASTAAFVALDAASPVFESGRLPRSEQPTARYEETLPLPGTTVPLDPRLVGRAEVGTARFEETLPLPASPPSRDAFETKADPAAVPLGAAIPPGVAVPPGVIPAPRPNDPVTDTHADPLAAPHSRASGPPYAESVGASGRLIAEAGPLTPPGAPGTDEIDTRDDPAVHGAAESAAPDDGSPRAWVPGLRLGPDLVLGEKVGEGAMGAVFAAERNGARVAVKVLPTNAHPVAVERFKREGAAQAAADAHPAIARVLGSGEAHGRLFLVIEHLPGGDLQRRIDAQGPLPWRQAVELVAALARGVAHVHARGVLHRDLKPANVMFDAEGAPRIVDFGVARVAGGEALTMTGAVVGTPAFCSPEQAGGDGAQVDERADVYGLGAILFASLCGRPPFDGPSVPNVITKVLREPPPAPSSLVSGLPSSVDRVVLSALAKERVARPRSAAAMAEDLERILRGEDVEATAPRRPIPPWLLPVGVALGLAAIAVVAGRARFAAVDPPTAALDVAPLASADAVVVGVTIGGTEPQARLFVDGRPSDVALPGSGAARITVPVAGPGQHTLRLVVEGPDGTSAEATMPFTRLMAPVVSVDPTTPRWSTGGKARLIARVAGTWTEAWLEVDGARQVVPPAAFEGAALDLTFAAPQVARSRVRVIAREGRLGAEHASDELVWSDLPPAPDGMRLGHDGVYVNERDGSRLRWIWPGSGHLGLEERPEDFMCIAEGAGNRWRAVTIEEGFFLGEREVTRGQLLAYCAAKGLRPPPPGVAVDVNARRVTAGDQHPAVNLPWSMARDYCEWAGLRLPREVEWEWAVRGPEALRYPWGQDPQVEERLANTLEYLPFWEKEGGVFPTGTFPPAVLSGCYDLAGNVWEYMDDVPDPATPDVHVNRGGAFNHPRIRAHAGFRWRDLRAARGSDNTGLRVARGWREVGPAASLPFEPE